MLLKELNPLFVKRFEVFFVSHFHADLPASNQSLQIFIPKNSANTAAPSCTFLTDYCSIPDFILSCRPNHKLSAFFFTHFFLGFTRQKTPKMFCTLNLYFIIRNINIYFLLTFSRDDNAVITSLFQVQSKISTA